MGYSLLHLGKMGMATKIFEQLIKEGLSKFDLYREEKDIGNIKYFYGEIKKEWNVIFNLKERILNEENLHEFYRELGQGYFGLGLYQKTIKYYKKYLEIEENDWEFWCYLAEIHESQKNFEKALFCYEMVVNVGDEEADAPFGFIENHL